MRPALPSSIRLLDKTASGPVTDKRRWAHIPSLPSLSPLMRKDSETGLDERPDIERIESDSNRAEPEIVTRTVILKSDPG